MVELPNTGGLSQCQGAGLYGNKGSDILNMAESMSITKVNAYAMSEVRQID